MSDLPPITLQRALSGSSCLLSEIPQLARVQGAVHHTRLPEGAAHAARIAENFGQAIAKNMVEIWHIVDPVAGAVFLSPLRKSDRSGLQMDDVVVLPAAAGRGYGAALICFTAALSAARGGCFVAWECERENPAAKTYRRLGAVERTGFTPFRLSRSMLDQLTMPDHADAVALSMTVSPRFSLFRTMCHGIVGYDLPADEKPNGIQIEDVAFSNVEEAQQAMTAALVAARQGQDIQFADIILSPENLAHLSLIAHFDAAQNTYSGSPAVLWELSGGAFDSAVEKARVLQVLGDMV